MKYMTKEWYGTMQKTDFHLSLKVSKKAEVFSEAYFEKLYRREEKEWLELQEEVANVTFEEIYPEEFEIHLENTDGSLIEGSELEELKREYFETREQACLSYEKNPPFDPEQEKKNFKEGFLYNIKHLRQNLPIEILEKVADIRVLALDRTSGQVKKEITAYCKANEEAVESAINAYWQEYKESFKNKEPDFAEAFDFHDCKVISCCTKDKDIILTLDNSGGFTRLSQVIFKDAAILKQDKLLDHAWWLYDEIYKTADGYEIHVLLEENELINFIVKASDVEYR